MSKEKTVVLLLAACALIGAGIEYVVHVQSPLSGVLVGILGFIVSMFVCSVPLGTARPGREGSAASGCRSASQPEENRLMHAPSSRTSPVPASLATTRITIRTTTSTGAGIIATDA